MKEICKYCGTEYGTRIPRGGCKHCVCRICGLLRKRTGADVVEYCECPVFRPATAIWFAKEDGKEWCRKHMPSLFDRFGSAPVCGIYLISFGSVPLYVGRAVDITPRIIGHAFVLHTQPELFGLEKDEIEDLSVGAQLSIRVLEECSYEDSRSNEIKWINDMHPVIQLGGSSDRCIPMKERRSAIQSVILHKEP